jgi:hypothetical protein
MRSAAGANVEKLLDSVAQFKHRSGSVFSGVRADPAFKERSDWQLSEAICGARREL